MENWFYIVDDEQVGPRSIRDILDLVEEGQITSETLLWTDGLEDWQPYRFVATRIASSAVQDASPDQIGCPSCGAAVAADDLARMGDTLVCPHCKEGYVQRIREGLDPRIGHHQFAGFGIRFCAYFLDGIILGAVQVVVSTLLGFLMANPAFDLLALIINQVLSLAIGLSYYVLFWGHPRFQATPGKLACRLRVVCVEADRMTYARALGRYFSMMLSAFTLCIGFLMCIWDEEKRCLHDRICNTRVVYV